MRNQVLLSIICMLFRATNTWLNVEAQSCEPSGRLRGKTPPPGLCNHQNDSECCEQGKFYNTFTCSPPVTSRTRANLTLNSFQQGGDVPSACDNQFHTDREAVVALSTGWFSQGKRCLNEITIVGNGRSVKAKVVDECDSTVGCDAAHACQPPCPNNIVGGSSAVWEALEVPGDEREQLDIFWSDS